MSKSPITISSATSTTTLLAILFLALKLIPTGDPAKHQHLINWSWWLVLAPIWVPYALILVILILCLIALGVATFIGRK